MDFSTIFKVTKSSTKRCTLCLCVLPRRSFEFAVLFTAGTAELLRPKEELLKQLLTSASSADHRLVSVPWLPGDRTVVHPHLTEGSKCYSVSLTSLRTSQTGTFTELQHEVLVNNLAANLICVTFTNHMAQLNLNVALINFGA